MKICLLMRGLPGSGKSTRARAIAAEYLEQGRGVAVCSSDHFFECGSCGNYAFRLDRLDYAHHWCQKKAREAIGRGEAVLIDNTNVSARECRPYVEMALAASYEVVFVEPQTPWAFDLDELEKRNTHGVPRHALEKMLGRWVPDMTIEKALGKGNRGGRPHEDERSALVAAEGYLGGTHG